MSDGIVVDDNVFFVNLKVAIAAKLDVDESRKKLLIQYVIEDNSFPITICNDIGVRLYIEIKKKEPEFRMYPLCIDIVDLNLGELQSFNTTCGSVHCAEIQQKEKNVLGLVESNMDNSCYATEVDESYVINGVTSLEIKEKQMYRDKSTLVSLMGKYKMGKGFNFRVKRSYSKMYVINCCCVIIFSYHAFFFVIHPCINRCAVVSVQIKGK